MGTLVVTTNSREAADILAIVLHEENRHVVASVNARCPAPSGGVICDLYAAYRGRPLSSSMLKKLRAQISAAMCALRVESWMSEGKTTTP